MKEKKILITGSAGMIGTVLSKYFLDSGYSVVGIDNLSGGYLRNVDSRSAFFQGDILDVQFVNNIFQKESPHFVIHCAAFAAEILSPFCRNYNYSNNLLGSINIINACINYGVKKIINFSSIATYGDQKPPYTENLVRVPTDCYGIAKLAVEMDLEEAKEHFSLEYSTVLPHNVVSKYQNYFDKYRNAIAIWVRQCLLGEDITIFGDGEQTRAFSDCKYLCQPIEALLYNFNGYKFNIGSDQPIKIKDAAQLVIDVYKEKFGDSKVKLNFLPPRREHKHVYSSHDLAKELLNFKDETNLKDLISEMFDYAAQLPKEKVTNIPYEIEKGMYDFWK